MVSRPRGRVAMIAVGLVAVVAVAVAGWYAAGSRSQSASGSPAAANSSATARPTPPLVSVTPTPRPLTYANLVVGFVEAGTGSSWLAANHSSFLETAVEKGVTLMVGAAGHDLASQLADLNQFIADPRINVIVLDPVRTTGYDDALEAAKKAGKLVILEDGNLDSDPALYYTRVGSDFEAEGELAASTMCSLLVNSARKNVVQIGGDLSSMSVGRAMGFRKKMGDCGITLTLSTNAAGADRSAGRSIMAAYLGESRDIQGVFALDDELAIGAIEAIGAAGLKAGKDIQVEGFTTEGTRCWLASADAMKQIVAGTLGADLVYSPLLAPQAYDAALQGLNGGTGIPKFIAAQEDRIMASQGAAAFLRCGSVKY